MLVEERGLKEGLAGPSFSLLNLRQSYFSCKQAKLLPEIKECSGERRVSQNLEREGTLMYLMIDKGAVLLFFFFFLVYFYIPWHFSCLYIDFLCYGMCLSKIAISCLLLSHVSHVRFLATPWTVAYQAPLSIGFPRQEYWSGLPLPSPVPCLAYSFVHITPVWKNELISSPFEVDSVQFICSVVSDSLWPWTAASQASLSITNTQSLLKLMSIELLMPSHHLILCCPLLLLPSIFPSIRVFPMSQFFASAGQRIGVSASASVLPMNIQDWFPLALTGLISLQSEGLLRVFSNTTVQKHQFFNAQLSWYSHIHTCLLEKP